MRLAACLFLALLASLAPVAGAGARGSDPSPLEGTWKARKATTQQLVARGMFPSAAEALARLHVQIPAVDFHAGRARWFDLATGKTTCIGPYVVRDDQIGVALSSCPVKVPPGYTWMRWSLFRDRLTFSALPGRSSIIPITIFPWVRVR